MKIPWLAFVLSLGGLGLAHPGGPTRAIRARDAADVLDAIGQVQTRLSALDNAIVDFRATVTTALTFLTVYTVLNRARGDEFCHFVRAHLHTTSHVPWSCLCLALLRIRKHTFCLLTDRKPHLSTVTSTGLLSSADLGTIIRALGNLTEKVTQTQDNANTQVSSMRSPTPQSHIYVYIYMVRVRKCRQDMG